MADVLGPARYAAVCRELTKRHESVYRGSLAELAEGARTGAITLKGEFVVVVDGAPDGDVPALAELDELLRLLAVELPLKKVAAILARTSGHARNAIYERGLAVTRRDKR